MTEVPIATNNPWVHPLISTPAPSLSERLIHALEAHASAEAHDLATCEALAQSSSDPVLKLLMGLVADDEQRHHSLLQSMIRRLHEEVDFVKSPSALPFAEVDSAADDELVTSLRALIRNEHEGARHLRHIARRRASAY